MWPSGVTQPLVSTLNADDGQITANAAIVPAGTNGDISVFGHDDTDLVVDINGYFAPPATGRLSLYSFGPCRVFDSRLNNGSPVPASATKIDMASTSCGAPATAKAYLANVTVVPQGVLHYLTLWPDGGQQPLVSTLNATGGAIPSNMAIIPATNGMIDAFPYDPTHLVVDLLGYFQ